VPPTLSGDKDIVERLHLAIHRLAAHLEDLAEPAAGMTGRMTRPN
jgi:hypothetical protein